MDFCLLSSFHLREIPIKSDRRTGPVPGPGEFDGRKMQKAKPLTAIAVAKARTPGRYGDGGGLYLKVSAPGKRSNGGAKFWLFRWERDGKEKALSLGPLHTVSLAVQQEVVRAMHEMVGLDAGPITVHVEDVAFTEEI